MYIPFVKRKNSLLKHRSFSALSSYSLRNWPTHMLDNRAGWHVCLFFGAMSERCEYSEPVTLLTSLFETALGPPSQVYSHVPGAHGTTLTCISLQRGWSSKGVGRMHDIAEPYCYSSQDDMDNGEYVDLGGTEDNSCRLADFKLLKVIGKGSFGKVLLASHKGTKRVYAIKVLNKSQVMKRDEVGLLLNLHAVRSSCSSSWFCLCFIILPVSPVCLRLSLHLLEDGCD